MLLLTLAAASDDDDDDDVDLGDDSAYFARAAANESLSSSSAPVQMRPTTSAAKNAYAMDDDDETSATYYDDIDEVTNATSNTSSSATTTTTRITNTSAAVTTTTAEPTSTTTAAQQRVVLPSGLVAVARGPPIELGVPPANETTEYAIPGEPQLALRVPAGAWLWDDDAEDEDERRRRRKLPVRLTVTVLELPRVFVAPSANNKLILATSRTALSLAPAGKRPRRPLEVRIIMPGGSSSSGYVLLKNGTARACADLGDGWSAVGTLGVVFAGAELPIALGLLPPPHSPPTTAINNASAVRDNTNNIVARGSPVAVPTDNTIPATLGAIAGGVGLWAVVLVAWRRRFLVAQHAKPATTETTTTQRPPLQMRADAVFAVV
jgi:hypothetical protein